MSIAFVGCAAANFRAGRRGFRPEAIVIHVMAGTMQGTRAWFANPAAQVSAHYGVGRDGTVEQYVRETDTAFHAGTIDQPDWKTMKPTTINPNYYTIGIEHEGTGTAPWPTAQLNASAALVADIARRWGITIDEQHLILHHQIRKAKPCPGPSFDKGAFISRVGTVRPAAAGATGTAPPNVKTMASANVRGAARPDSQLLRQIASGQWVRVTGKVAGALVDGNTTWFAVDGGGFIWAGATDHPGG